ncbi:MULTISPECIES: helix-turn-helix transcriptional regulator [Providencia]|uniref:Transcriptional regulator n=1 Tax=Providencia rettgeri TaxID=587 RepID=A0AB35LEM4_PRORE|nr:MULTISPECIES: metalloregulator ArsR/SmtB family transcription factor [Providencia]MBG5924387.1 transcriptional regulator [Providencia rettgeri]MCG5379714.1 transcriptional regulator [Providencia rettgeri]MDH2306932.1 transcriptional regulator [Providencia rettgeri]MDL9988523.1 transcriptional regulator [Providencia rettgeri]OBY36945.1 transcriptional regulator [Providencia rettgeri]
MINASNYFDNLNLTQAVDKVLFCIKTKGPISTAVIANDLNMTGEAARQHIQKLTSLGLVEGAQCLSQTGAGRPRQNWVLTKLGHQRFPDTHAQLALQLIDSVRTIFGDEGLEKLISQRETESREKYFSRCKNLPLAERLEALAEVRSEEGYMAKVEQDDDSWLFIENHCPICAAATACQNFCRSELALFSDIVGDDASIEREQYLLNGAGRCVYRVKVNN